MSGKGFWLSIAIKHGLTDPLLVLRMVTLFLQPMYCVSVAVHPPHGENENIQKNASYFT